MQRTTLFAAVVLAALLGLIVAAPASAATTGTLCGQVTAFAAPIAATADGSITIDGTTEVIDSSAAIDAGTITTLTMVADADATTCVEITADSAGEIVELDIAAQAEICGTAAVDTTTGVHSIGGVDLPASLVSADAELAAFLDAAATADATVCADVTIDDGSGAITTISLSATLTACGEVTLDAEGDASVGDMAIDESLLDANAAALLALAASADGTACASVNAVSNDGDTTVGITVTIEVCAEVTAITDGTVTLGDVTFVFAGAADADIEIGDEACVSATTAPTGELIITGVGDDVAAGGAGDGEALLPDTATDRASGGLALGGLLVIAAGIGFHAVRRRELDAR